MQLLRGVEVVVVAGVLCGNSLLNLPQVNIISSRQVVIDLWGSHASQCRFKLALPS